MRQIVSNAGGEGSVVVANVKNGKGAYGYNARADKYEDMYKAGIIDPTKVARVALENAASIAAMFLTTECVLVNKKEAEAPAAMPQGMGGSVLLRKYPAHVHTVYIADRNELADADTPEALAQLEALARQKL